MDAHAPRLSPRGTLPSAPHRIVFRHPSHIEEFAACTPTGDNAAIVNRDSFRNLCSHKTGVSIPLDDSDQTVSTRLCDDSVSLKLPGASAGGKRTTLGDLPRTLSVSRETLRGS